jgi:hypothetical protein
MGHRRAGWVFLGYYDPKMQGLTGVPLHKVVRSSFSLKAPLPREGEWLQLLTKREIIISDFQNSGTQLRDTPPWKIDPALLPEDETGLSLVKGSVVEVREVAPGQFPEQNWAIWVKIGARARVSAPSRGAGISGVTCA